MDAAKLDAIRKRTEAAGPVTDNLFLLMEDRVALLAEVDYLLSRFDIVADLAFTRGVNAEHDRIAEIAEAILAAVDKE